MKNQIQANYANNYTKASCYAILTVKGIFTALLSSSKYAKLFEIISPYTSFLHPASFHSTNIITYIT